MPVSLPHYTLPHSLPPSLTHAHSLTIHSVNDLPANRSVDSSQDPIKSLYAAAAHEDNSHTQESQVSQSNS